MEGVQGMKKVWQEIKDDLQRNPRDIPTVPKQKKEPLWFHASSDGNYVYISNAKTHRPSSSIKGIRNLSEAEFERIYPIHIRREKGEAVSKEAAKATMNQVYWYGILTACVK